MATFIDKRVDALHNVISVVLFAAIGFFGSSCLISDTEKELLMIFMIL